MIRGFLRFTILTYLIANAIASLLITLLGVRGLHYYQVLIVSLVFSFPAPIMLFPNYFIIHRIRERIKRIGWSIISILLICVLVASIFMKVIEDLPVSFHDIIIVLITHAVAGVITFMVVSRKLIFHSHCEKP